MWSVRRFLRPDAATGEPGVKSGNRPTVPDGTPSCTPRWPVLPNGEWPPVRVRCATVWHWMRIGDGRLNAVDHTDAEIQREFALGGLGGPVAGCAAVLRTWRTGRGRLPRDLRWQRRMFFLYARQGRTDEVLAMLDAGFDVTAPDPDGATLVHYLVHLDHERLWPRLRAAGLSVDARDHQGYTALQRARGHRNVAVERLLLAAQDDDGDHR